MAIKNKKIFIFLNLSLLLIIFSFVFMARAEAAGGFFTDVSDACYNNGDCQFCDLAKVAANIFRFLRDIAFYIAVLMIIYGGIMLIFSGGSPKRIENGRKILTSAIIGFAIVVGVSLILNIVLTVATGSSLTWQGVVNGRLGCTVAP